MTREDYIYIFSHRLALSWTNLVGLHVFFQVCSAEPSVPVISDVPSIHDLPKKIPKVLPWHLHRHNHYKTTANTTTLFIFTFMLLYIIASTHNTNNISHLCISFQVVVEYINWYSQVSSVEGVLSVPTLGSKLPPLCHTSMEVTEREEDGLKLLLTTALVQNVLQGGQWINTLINKCSTVSTTCFKTKIGTHLVKVIQSCMQIGKHACRRFISDFDGIFQDPLRKTHKI